MQLPNPLGRKPTSRKVLRSIGLGDYTDLGDYIGDYICRSKNSVTIV